MWPEFQKKHILDPRSLADSNYSYWNRAQWNEWLHHKLGDKYGIIDVNSVIITSPESLLDDVKNHSHSYNHSEYWWSNEKYPIYLLKKVYQVDHGMFDYDVIDLGTMYFLVKLSPENEPTQFKAQFMDRPPHGNINLNLSHYRKIQ